MITVQGGGGSIGDELQKTNMPGETPEPRKGERSEHQPAGSPPDRASTPADVNTYVLTYHVLCSTLPTVAKTQQLQIRVSPAEKARLKRLASRAGQDVSAYVLSRVLSPDADRLAALLGALRRAHDRRFVLAELNDLLTALAPVQFHDAVARADPGTLSPLLRNYVAAMVEQAAGQKGVESPEWVREIAPLDEPHFGADLESLRMYLLRAAPVAFKRRNIFVDAAVGDRV